MIVQLQRKPVRPGSPIHVARYDGSSESVEAIADVARMTDRNAAAVVVPEFDVVLVRWLEVPDDHPARRQHVTVERGKWLSFSEDSDLLYVTDDADLNQWYERPDGEAIS